MNGQNFRKKIDQLWLELNTAIDHINRRDSGIINCAEEILMETDSAIRQLKELLRRYQFADWSEEIWFFKL
jgi:hypothetical protein